MRPCAPCRRVEWMGDNPPSKQIYFLGLLREFMALKRLQCCGNSSLPERFEVHKHPQPPQRIHPQARGVIAHPFEASARIASFMWGARGAFSPAAAKVVEVVTPVVFCAKATEKRNKNTKLSWWLTKHLFITIYCKTYCNSYIANSSVARVRVGMAGARTTMVQWTPAYWALSESSCHCKNDK
jgi:hypothetical protein